MKKMLILLICVVLIPGLFLVSCKKQEPVTEQEAVTEPAPQVEEAAPAVEAPATVTEPAPAVEAPKEAAPAPAPAAPAAPEKKAKSGGY